MEVHFRQMMDQGEWLMDISLYNQTPDISLEQAERITTYLALNTRDRQRSSLENALTPILSPLMDAIHYLGLSYIGKKMTRYLLLQHTLQTGRTIWSWTDAEMIDYLNHDPDLNTPHRRMSAKQPILSIFYLLRGFTGFEAVHLSRPSSVARWVFGKEAYENLFIKLRDLFLARGYDERWCKYNLAGGISYILLKQFRWSLDTLSFEFLQHLYDDTQSANYKMTIARLVDYLKGQGHLSASIQPNWNRKQKHFFSENVLADVPSEWVTMCQRWLEKSPRKTAYARHKFYTLLKIGRWLQANHPEKTHPASWTRNTALSYTAMVCEMCTGDWTTQLNRRKDIGKPLSVSAIQDHLTAASNFFGDCMEWGWIERRFDPRLYFRLPHHLRQLDQVQPRVIDEDIWAKLLYAGLNLELEDLYAHPEHLASGKIQPQYPIEMIRTLAIVWLFAALRRSEIRRLRLNCIHWQDERVCLLEIPPGKSGRGRTIAVDGIVGQSIEQWQQVRPPSAKTYDATTATEEDFLFSYRHNTLGLKYINRTLIPALCRKMNIPQSDTLGNITSHRARSTIATQLANADDAMSFLQLKDWLGHQRADATQRYIALTPTKLAQAYTDAGYFERNLRQIQVLIDRDALDTQGTQDDKPWKYYDLTHGYCTYDFFQTCPHLLACARCSHYVPKASSEAQILEAKQNLLRLKEAIPLTDEMEMAVQSGLEAVQALIERLQDVPTPSGQTPRQLGQQMHAPNLILLDDIPITSQE